MFPKPLFNEIEKNNYFFLVNTDEVISAKSESIQTIKKYDGSNHA